jgi:hypothetical protein
MFKLWWHARKEVSMSTARYGCNLNNKDQPSERSHRKTNTPQVIAGNLSL